MSSHREGTEKSGMMEGHRNKSNDKYNTLALRNHAQHGPAHDQEDSWEAEKRRDRHILQEYEKYEEEMDEAFSRRSEEMDKLPRSEDYERRHARPVNRQRDAEKYRMAKNALKEKYRMEKSALDERYGPVAGRDGRDTSRSVLYKRYAPVAGRD